MPNSNYSNTRVRSRLAQSIKANLGEIRSRSSPFREDCVSTPNHVPTMTNGNFSSGKRRRVESRNEDSAWPFLRYERDQPPAVRSRDAMPPPSIPTQIPRKLNNSSYSQDRQSEQNLSLPMMNLCKRGLIFSPETSNVNVSGRAAITPGAKIQTGSSRNRRGGSFAQPNQVSPPFCAYQMNSNSEVLCPGIEQDADSTLLYNNHGGRSQGILDRQSGSPYLNNPVNSRGSKVALPGFDTADARINRRISANCDEAFLDHPTITHRNRQNGVSGAGSPSHSQKSCPVSDGEINRQFSDNSNLADSTSLITPTRITLPLGRRRFDSSSQLRTRRWSSICPPPSTPASFRAARERLSSRMVDGQRTLSTYFNQQNSHRHEYKPGPQLHPSQPFDQARKMMVPTLMERNPHTDGNRRIRTKKNIGEQTALIKPGSGNRRPSTANMRRANR